MSNPQALTKIQKLIITYLSARKGGTRQNLLDNFQERVSLCSLNTDLDNLIKRSLIKVEKRTEHHKQFNQSQPVTVRFYTVSGE
jgi:hypothetical protein